MNNKKLIERIFQRSNDPLSQIERIEQIVPVFFTDSENIKVLNQHLRKYKYQINTEYVETMKNDFGMMMHSSCGATIGGHPSCGYGGGYGGYSGGHSSCGYRGGYPSCCSSNSMEKTRSMLLIKTDNKGRYNGISN